MSPKFRLSRKPGAAKPGTSATQLAMINTALSLTQTIVITVLGFWLTGRLDLALKERQTTVQNADKMAALVKEINDSGVAEDMRIRKVSQLSMYGGDAVFPLFVLAASRSDYPPETAIDGLRLLAVRYRTEVCDVLVSATAIPQAIHEPRRNSVDDLVSELVCMPREKSR